MRFGSFTKKAFATMGSNIRASKVVASGSSYFRWAATGAAMGAVTSAGANVTNMGPEGKKRIGFMESVKRGAMAGAGVRMLKGMGTASANRRRARRGR